MNGFIKIHRELLDKPIWYNSTPEHKAVLVTLLLMANFKPATWEWGGKNYKAKRGQFVTSLGSIKKRSGKGISIQNVRSALVRFKKLEFLTYESTKTGRLITIVNWDDYQINDNDQQSNQQTGNKEVTTNEECKNVKKLCLYRNSEFCDNIPLIKKRIGNKYKNFDFEYYNEQIKNWSNAKGRMQKDWLAFMRNWMLKANESGKAKFTNK